MEDCELFNVCSTEIRSVVISISSIICVYLAISKKASIRKEVVYAIYIGYSIVTVLAQAIVPIPENGDCKQFGMITDCFESPNLGDSMKASSLTL